MNTNYSKQRIACLLTMVLLAGFSVLSTRAANSDNLAFLSPLPTGNTINDSWSPDGTNFFFAGDGGTILFYDGTDFSVMPTPTDWALKGIHGTSMTDIWAVGGTEYSDGATDPNRSVLLHYDGSTWSSVAAPNRSIRAILHI